MIVIFLVLAFLRTLRAVPIPASAPLDVDTILIRDDIASTTDAYTRSTFDLTKSCVLTVLACVWTAGHPNIPGPRDSTWTCLKRRGVMMVCALIAPELMAMWALRQWGAAKKIADDYNATVVGSYSDWDWETVELKKSHLPWENLWNDLKKSCGWVKEGLSELPLVCMTRRKDLSIAAQENLSIWRYLRLDWAGESLWRRMRKFLQEFFIELPKERSKRGKGQAWTTTHGFFIQMGGFLLYENDYPKQVLDYNSMKELIRNKQIDAPMYTEFDLHDRSKGDTISKAVVVLQTTWFVIQCVTRLCAGLPLSELEVVTLGFAVLNAIIYSVWWNKPQGVGLAVFIPLKEKEDQAEPADELENENSRKSQRSCEESLNIQKLAEGGIAVEAEIHPNVDLNFKKENHGGGVTKGVAAETVAGPLGPMETDGLIFVDNFVFGRQGTSDVGSEATEDTSSTKHARGSVEETSSTTGVARSMQQEDTTKKTTVKKVWLQQTFKEDREAYHWLIFLFLRAPLICLTFFLRPLGAISGIVDDSISDGAHRVPTFYANRRGTEDMTGYVSCVIGIVFGAIHLLAWSSSFLSRTELFLWRISTVIIIVEPTLLTILMIFTDHDNTRLGKALRASVAIPTAIVAPLYVMARFTLIVLAFLSLQALPHSAFVTIPWTSYIPHL